MVTFDVGAVTAEVSATEGGDWSVCLDSRGGTSVSSAKRDRCRWSGAAMDGRHALAGSDRDTGYLRETTP